MKNKTLIFLLVATVMIGTVVYIIRGARKSRSKAFPPSTDGTDPISAPVAFIGGGGGGGPVGGGGGYSLSSSAARDPQWWPQTWRITLTESQGSIKSFTLKFKQGSTVISQRTVQNHNSFATPFLTFVPFNDGLLTAGSYSVEVSTVVSGVTYTSTANFTLTAEDLPNGFVLQTAVNRDPNWWPYTQRITLNETTRGTRDYVLTFKTGTGSTISTRTVTGHNSAAVGFLTFVPVNEGITTPGAYQVTVSEIVSGTTYTHTSTFSLTADDFATVGTGTDGTGTTTGYVVGWVEPADPNANVEMIVSPSQITGRFKISGGSGAYNGTAKKAGVTVGTASAINYGTYLEMSINRFFNQEDLSGQTLTWEFEKSSVVTSITFFTPEVVTREYVPEMNFNGQNVEYPYFEDRILQLRITKPFDSGRIKLEDVGENAGMIAKYWKNGSQARNGNTFNASVLSPRPVPAMRHVQIIKYLVDPSFGNINDTNNSLFYGSQTYNKLGARLEFWIRTAANQNI